MKDEHAPRLRRRDLLSAIGAAAGSSVMYQAMTSLGLAAESDYKGRIELAGAPKGASVLILGAGLAGMTAAFELRRAGYKVQILEYNSRAGGRNWTLRGGDSVVELGGATQICAFDKGLYFEPGPWRIPYHHRAILDYCKRFGVALEPFLHLNYNAYLHSTRGFDGKPQRLRTYKADLQGHVAELLAKTTRQAKLDEAVSREDREILLEALKSWGGLDKDYRYKAGVRSAMMRGYRKDPGGGLGGAPIPGEPLALPDMLRSGLWAALANFDEYYYQTTMLQPVGGMDMIGRAFAKEVGELIRFDSKVTRIEQDARRVTVTCESAKGSTGSWQATADWCICTIPLSILSQIPIDVGAPMKAAIGAVPYTASVKAGLQFKRRFWEEDEAIYGGVTYTDLPIEQIAYPSTGLNSGGKGVLMGAYSLNRPASYELTALPPDERVRRIVELGRHIHPQYRTEFETGVAVAWHRVPFALGCAADWSDEARLRHYDDLCQLDGRIMLAGEHVSYLPSWQEGAILSALDAIARLHRRVMAI